MQHDAFKSAGRRQATVIPSWIAPPAANVPRLFRDPLAEPPPPPTEPRRILPSLIVLESPEPEPKPVAADDRLQPGRGCPRKAPAAVIEATAAEPISTGPVTVAAPVEPVRQISSAPAPIPVKRTTKDGAALASGER